MEFFLSATTLFTFGRDIGQKIVDLQLYVPRVRTGGRVQEKGRVIAFIAVHGRSDASKRKEDWQEMNRLREHVVRTVGIECQVI